MALIDIGRRAAGAAWSHVPRPVAGPTERIATAATLGAAALAAGAVGRGAAVLQVVRRRTQGRAAELEVLAGPEALSEAVAPLRDGPPEPPATNPPAEAVAVGAPGVAAAAADRAVRVLDTRVDGAALSQDDLPVEDYDHLSIASLRARLARVDLAGLAALRDYEKAHADRLPVVTMLENRIAKVQTQSSAAG
jgi:hypothetical protein